MSPEFKNGQACSYNTDCWSVGCILYELITLVRFQSKGLNTDGGIQQEIIGLDTIDYFKELLRKMLQVDRLMRAEISAIKLIEPF